MYQTLSPQRAWVRGYSVYVHTQVWYEHVGCRTEAQRRGKDSEKKNQQTEATARYLFYMLIL